MGAIKFVRPRMHFFVVNNNNLWSRGWTSWHAFITLIKLLGKIQISFSINHQNPFTLIRSISGWIRIDCDMDLIDLSRWIKMIGFCCVHIWLSCCLLVGCLPPRLRRIFFIFSTLCIQGQEVSSLINQKYIVLVYEVEKKRRVIHRHYLSFFFYLQITLNLIGYVYMNRVRLRFWLSHNENCL